MHAFADSNLPRPANRRALSVLDSVQIARPCPADWEAMRPVPGLEHARVRHCEQCRLRVYNLSAMKRDDAEQLLRTSEGRLCVRLYRREDGTVLTQDCSFLRRAVEKGTQGARQAAWLAACALAGLMGSAVYASTLLRDNTGRGPERTNFVQSGLDKLAQIRPIQSLINWLRPPPPMPGIPQGTWLAGAAPAVLMGDVVQGRLAPIEPMPRTPPEQWLAPSQPPAIPL